LVALARAGDPDAFGRLLDRYHRDCLRFARWMLGDPHRAEDAVQDAMLRAFRALPRYQEQTQFRAWLFQILVNRCRSLRHRWHRWAERHDSLDRVGEIQVDPEAGSAEEFQALQRIIDELPTKMREAFLLKHGEGFSYEEIAEQTGVSVPALKMRVKRAREVLRDRLGGTDDAR
jgi:RNA polymerase sigma-70 factor (ECF subfamily)